MASHISRPPNETPDVLCCVLLGRCVGFSPPGFYIAIARLYTCFFLRRQEMLYVYVGVGFELDKKSLGLVVLLAWNAAKGLIFFLPSLCLWKLPPPINLPRMPCTDLWDVVYFFCGRFLVLFLSKSGRKARRFLIG